MCDDRYTRELDVVMPARLSSTGCPKPKMVAIDACIADLVESLNMFGVPTANACCGHGRGPGSIVLHDGSALLLQEADRG